MFHLVHSEVAGVVKEITWQLAMRRADSRILQWLLAGLMLIIGLAVGILGQNWPSSAVHCTSR